MRKVDRCAIQCRCHSCNVLGCIEQNIPAWTPFGDADINGIRCRWCKCHRDGERCGCGFGDSNGVRHRRHRGGGWSDHRRDAKERNQCSGEDVADMLMDGAAGNEHPLGYSQVSINVIGLHHFPQTCEGFGLNPADMHLRNAKLTGDHRLCFFIEEAKLDDDPLAFRKL